jgi:hypothetical protein
MELCQQRGVHRSHNIQVTVYPAAMSDDDCVAVEIHENLKRKNLSAEEDAAHRTWLVALKAKAIEAKKKNGTGGNSVSTSLSDGRGAGPQHEQQAAALVAHDLGMTRQALNKSVAKDLEPVGLTRQEFDAASPDEKVEIAHEAVKMARVAAAAPKAPRKRVAKTPEPIAATITPPFHGPEVAECLFTQAEAASALPSSSGGEVATPLIDEAEAAIEQQVDVPPAIQPVLIQGAEVVTLDLGDAGGANGLSRLDAAWEAATDAERAEFVIGHKMQIRGYITADVRKTCAAILAHPELGDKRAYFTIFPDLPTEAQDHTLQQQARKLGVER